MRVKATAFAEGAGGKGRAITPILYLVAVLGVVAALAFLFGQIRDTVSLVDPEVRAAQARTAVAEANLHTAQAQHQRRAEAAQERSQAAWQPWQEGARQLATVALLGAIPVGLLLALGAGILLFRRHLSLPTSDGRVPLVGLDRELSAEALFRYQALQAKRSGYEVLPPPGRPARGELSEAEGWESETERLEGDLTSPLPPKGTEG
jgi:hypothetical protein